MSLSSLAEKMCNSNPFGDAYQLALWLLVEGMHGILCPVMIAGGELQLAYLALTSAPGEVKPLWVTKQVAAWLAGMEDLGRCK